MGALPIFEARVDALEALWEVVLADGDVQDEEFAYWITPGRFRECPKPTAPAQWPTQISDWRAALRCLYLRS